MEMLRGHKIVQVDGVWRYADTMEETALTHERRSCGHCGRGRTPTGHDGCLGTLPGVMNACCGHGERRKAYVQFRDGNRFNGEQALQWAVTARRV